MPGLAERRRVNEVEKRHDEALRAPIAEAMKAYAADGARAYHTPGHKQGLGAHPLLKALVTEEGLREEVSLMEELDDLHEPTMCIKEAQEMAAALYGADQAFFMINGTTGAIHTMLMGALAPGDTVLVPRNAHRSVIGGIILAGARPVFLQPEVDERLGIAMGLTEETVRSAIAAHPEAKALVCVYPTYYGVTYSLAEIAELVHAHGMLLLVDEAHGPHLRFSDDLPPQAIDCGADMAAQSTHKILGAMTQASMLFTSGPRVSRERVREAASLLQSTSPNQLLLASLDIARLQMAEVGQEQVRRAVRLAEKLRRAINEIDGLWSFGPEYTDYPGATGSIRRRSRCRSRASASAASRPNPSCATSTRSSASSPMRATCSSSSRTRMGKSRRTTCWRHCRDSRVTTVARQLRPVLWRQSCPPCPRRA